MLDSASKKWEWYKLKESHLEFTVPKLKQLYVSVLFECSSEDCSEIFLHAKNEWSLAINQL